MYESQCFRANTQIQSATEVMMSDACERDMALQGRAAM